MNAAVRRITPADGPLLRDLRLRALTDSPAAFGSSYEAEVMRPPDEWAVRAEARSAGEDACTFIAEVSGAAIGLAGGYRAGPGEVELVSMWVDPAARRQGAGRSLVTAVLGWAQVAGAERVTLWVTRGNTPAERLYERCGFAFTGEAQPVPSHPDLTERRMTLSPVSGT